MSLLKYTVDLRSLPEAEREKVFDLLDRITETGLSPTPVKGVFSCYLDEALNPDSLPGSTGKLLRPAP